MPNGRPTCNEDGWYQPTANAAIHLVCELGAHKGRPHSCAVHALNTTDLSPVSLTWWQLPKVAPR